MVMTTSRCNILNVLKLRWVRRWWSQDGMGRRLGLPRQSSELLVAEFYFWYSGNAMQKSAKGLLQSVLYQIIEKFPQLTQVLCPQRWNDAIERKALQPWMESELFEALEVVSKADHLV